MGPAHASGPALAKQRGAAARARERQLFKAGRSTTLAVDQLHDVRLGEALPDRLRDARVEELVQLDEDRPTAQLWRRLGIEQHALVPLAVGQQRDPLRRKGLERGWFAHAG